MCGCGRSRCAFLPSKPPPRSSAEGSGSSSTTLSRPMQQQQEGRLLPTPLDPTKVCEMAARREILAVLWCLPPEAPCRLY